MCYAPQMVSEIIFMFYSLHREGGVCRIHKLGSIKHDFQRLHGKGGALRGQTEMFWRDECDMPL